MPEKLKALFYAEIHAIVCLFDQQELVLNVKSSG